MKFLPEVDINGLMKKMDYQLESDILYPAIQQTAPKLVSATATSTAKAKLHKNVYNTAPKRKT